MKASGNKMTGRNTLKCGVSVVALSALAAITVPGAAFAQTATGAEAPGTADPGTAAEIVVTGVRASLATSQQLKKNADTVVDSITATDIGQFPDKSVAEALQRVAGITVNRFAASGDTAHFSAEPSGVIIRGLQQVRSEFNGRDIFNANSSRGLSFGDVSPELMGGVDAYKNQTADLIEGGIAGTVNLRTRLPFDAKGQQFALTFNENYGDLAKKWTPDVSALYSNRWETPIGDFGILADFARSKIRTETQGMQYGRIGPYQGFTTGGNVDQPNYGKDLVYIPSGLSARDTIYDRTRTGKAAAVQWRSLDRSLLVTGQYNSSSYHNVWHEHVISGTMGYGFYGNSVNTVCTPTGTVCNSVNAPQAAPGTPDFTFDDRGLFQSGVLTSDIGWWGASNAESAQFASNAQGQNLVNACYGWNGCTPSQRGEDAGTSTRFSDGHEKTSDMGLNVKWDATDALHFNFDYQHISSHVTTDDITVDMSTYANVSVVQPGNGVPTLKLLNPLNVNLSPGLFANPANYTVHDVMDHIEDSHGTENAFRADAHYDIHSTWLDSLRVGARYSDRKQNVQWSGYNWANVTNNWTQVNGQGVPQSAYWNITNTTPVGTFTGYQPNLAVLGTMPSNFLGGGHLPTGPYNFFNYSILQNPASIAKALGAPSIGVGSWYPICSHLGNRANEIKGSCFTPGEIDQVDEKTGAAYVMLKFGGDDATIFGHKISGNIGVRYVKTDDRSVGGSSVPLWDRTSAQFACTPNTPTTVPGAPVQPSTPYSVGCYIFGGNATTTLAGGGTTSTPTGLPGQPQEIAFNNGSTLATTVGAKHTNWLPSFNFKFFINDNTLIRFAASRAMSRPDIGLLKNYLSVSAGLPNTTNPVICGPTVTGVPCWTSTNGQISGINGVQPYYTAQAYNPKLKAVTADQFDLNFERYWGDVGQFSVDMFYKKFHDYIQYGTFFQAVTANGTTRNVQVSGPINQGGASLKGVEFAFQRFFDFLPDPLNGLGVQANFTYVKNSGLTNSNTSSVGSPSVIGGAVPDQLNPGTIEGLSKLSYNIIGMFEKGRFGARIAYNWKSRTLITALDCCVALPVWQKAQGYLDASIHFKVNDHIELDVQGNNLLNTKTVLEQQVTDVSKGRLLLPASWFQNDRRYQAGFRVKF